MLICVFLKSSSRTGQEFSREISRRRSSGGPTGPVLFVSLCVLRVRRGQRVVGPTSPVRKSRSVLALSKYTEPPPVWRLSPSPLGSEGRRYTPSKETEFPSPCVSGGRRGGGRGWAHYSIRGFSRISRRVFLRDIYVVGERLVLRSPLLV